jgi:hypothetical protein
MFSSGVKLMMNHDNINTVVIAATLVFSVIIGFTLYINDLSLNQGWAVQQQEDKGSVVGGVHPPAFQFEKNNEIVNNTVQTEITHPAITAGMVENRNITTMKFNATQLQQIDRSQFMKAPEFVQISGYLNTPENSPLTLSLTC